MPSAQNLELHLQRLLVALCRPAQLAARQVEAAQVVQGKGDASVVQAIGTRQHLEGLEEGQRGGSNQINSKTCLGSGRQTQRRAKGCEGPSKREAARQCRARGGRQGSGGQLNVPGNKPSPGDEGGACSKPRVPLAEPVQPTEAEG